jgi:hypothetical protein
MPFIQHSVNTHQSVILSLRRIFSQIPKPADLNQYVLERDDEILRRLRMTMVNAPALQFNEPNLSA